MDQNKSMKEIRSLFMQNVPIRILVYISTHSWSMPTHISKVLGLNHKRTKYYLEKFEKLGLIEILHPQSSRFKLIKPQKGHELDSVWAIISQIARLEDKK